MLGLENDMRARFFGADASTAAVTESLVESIPEFRSLETRHPRLATGSTRCSPSTPPDRARHPRRRAAVPRLGGPRAAHRLRRQRDRDAEPARGDARARARGDLHLHLDEQGLRRHAEPLPLVELETRLELPADHRYYDGIDETCRSTARLHSLFGVSKVAADLLVQEYGRYFGMPTVCFRGGCLTGPSHSGRELHGFLAYLMQCAVTGEPYTVFGYSGKQVRDNIHSARPRRARSWRSTRRRGRAPVYNIGGGRDEQLLDARGDRGSASGSPGEQLDWTLSDEARIGDHIWWISDLAEFQAGLSRTGRSVTTSTRSSGDARGERRPLAHSHGVADPAASTG